MSWRKRSRSNKCRPPWKYSEKELISMLVVVSLPLVAKNVAANPNDALSCPLIELGTD